MNRIVQIAAAFLFLVCQWAFSAELPDSQLKLLDQSGIPLFAGAQFVNGGLGNDVVGARFASKAAVEDVRKFYLEALPGWALQDKYGWILYKGKQSNSAADFMGKKSVTVQENKDMPGWFDLPKDMTTEIIILVP